jgi:hypothetical protein
MASVPADLPPLNGGGQAEKALFVFGELHGADYRPVAPVKGPEAASL